MPMGPRSSSLLALLAASSFSSSASLAKNSLSTVMPPKKRPLPPAQSSPAAVTPKQRSFSPSSPRMHGAAAAAAADDADEKGEVTAADEVTREEEGGGKSSASRSSPARARRIVVPSVTLRTVDGDGNPRSDVRMPMIGLGTYKFRKGSGEAREAVLEALSMGYRHIDTAFVYGGERTEVEVGEALAAAAAEKGLGGGRVERKDVFLTTKQWRSYHGYDATLRCLDLSLKRLNTDYVDLYLIHWPGPAYRTMARRADAMESSSDGPFVYARDGHSRADISSLRAETWRAMEDALYSGKVRSIGVSNFTVRHLEALRKTARIWPPAVNQVELHPYNPQSELVEYCRREDIAVVAYASLGGQDCGKKTWRRLGGPLLEREEVARIAEKHGTTVAQVLLRWATQGGGFAVIPKSTKAEHMRENLEAVCSGGAAWKGGGWGGLDAEDMELVAGLDVSGRALEEEGAELDSGAKAARLCWARDPLRHLDFD